MKSTPISKKKNVHMKNNWVSVGDQIFYLIFLWKINLIFFPKENREVQRPQWQDTPSQAQIVFFLQEGLYIPAR